MFGAGSRQNSRQSSTDEGFVMLDHQNMISEERIRTERSLKNVFQWIWLFRYDDAKSAVNMAFDSTLKQSGSATHTSGLMTPLKPVISAIIEKERDLVQSDLRKKGSIMKNIQTLSHNIAGRAYTPSTADRLVEKLRGDLKAIDADVNLSRTQNDVTALIKTVCRELEIYITARYINLHHHLISSFCKDGEIHHKESFTEDMKDIERLSKSIQSDALSPLREMLDYERNVVECLVNCSTSLVRWDFVSSLLHLQTFHSSYEAFMKGHKSKEKSMAGKRTTKEEYPELYKWFYRMYEMLLSKFTLYFSKTLFAESNKRSPKLGSATLQVVDYRAKLIDFSKRTKANSVTLLLNTVNVDFLGHGCKLLNSQRQDNPKEYSERFEAIFHHGKSPEKLEDEVKWSIVFLYNDVITKNFRPYLWEGKKNRTIFLCLIDENVFLALSYYTKRGERDAEICKFLEDIKSSLNFSKL